MNKKKIVLALTGLLGALVVSVSFSKNLDAEIKEINKDVIEWRHHFRRNPELSFQEVNTTAYIIKQLESFGNIEIKRPTKTGVLGILKGAKPGKTVAFRADIDALPVQETENNKVRSKIDGISHACGHDAHTAILLGTAKILSQKQQELAGTVIFLFQPAEELPPGGAIELVNSGAIKDVAAFFGLHVMPNFGVGHIGILPDGGASTASDRFHLTIQGKGSHGSMPHLGIDPIVTGAEVVTNLQKIVSRNITPGDMAVLTIGKFQSGNAPNVIPESAELAATIRTVTDKTRLLMEKRIKTIVNSVCDANEATCKLDYVLGYPAILNDAKLNAFAKKSVLKSLGEAQVFDAPRMSASEDFSYYGKIAPISFLFLGIGEGAANHSPHFNVDDAALANGVKAEVGIIMDYLNEYQ